ncbi:hypothetical protein AGABI1DRAFT_111154 [Agaricus bisporus var. burnettii JB137-S8]|uniref:Uncharacterized protein n=1 Tax=Agaricus bisporus var. burnettii (strain JB137-S8 / ATCC MYA-4627 / FGSC 10392) TaxID=597362 RepID=K5X3Y4_AGABU|nr:uncharacterized protein AGABI1DRAFT_111154 [Agaricus bisporus var. burnettii JB137-S8]EKM82546.1 hypothetical protein AGABI1DRAFT_111154 [Agaricus bisporus var. burnettii JB137-S8]
MLTHRGFSAWIVVDGHPLPEYLTTIDENAHRVTCWIPSEEGKAFSVHWMDHGGNVRTCGYIKLDGYTAPGRFLFGSGVAWRGGVRTGPATERPFIFQKVTEQTVGGSSSNNQDVLGTVILQIKRVKLTASILSNPVQQLPGPNDGREGMRVGFGEEQSLFDQYPTTWKVEPYDNPGQSKPSTFVSFVFHYRDPAFLHAQGIIEDPIISAAPVEGENPAQQTVDTPTNTAPARLSPPVDTENPVYYHIGSQRLEQSDMEFDRSVNPETRAGKEVRPVNYPGEGVIVFPAYRPIANPSQVGEQASDDTKAPPGSS